MSKVLVEIMVLIAAFGVGFGGGYGAMLLVTVAVRAIA